MSATKLSMHRHLFVFIQRNMRLGQEVPQTPKQGFWKAQVNSVIRCGHKAPVL